MHVYFWAKVTTVTDDRVQPMVARWSLGFTLLHNVANAPIPVQLGDREAPNGGHYLFCNNIRLLVNQ